MVKINLLPQHVVEKRKVRSFIKYPLIILAAEVVLFFLFVGTLAQKEKQLKQDYDNWFAQAEQVRGMEKKTQEEITAAAPFTSRVNWHKGIIKTNGQMADTLGYINEFLYANMTVQNLSVNGTSVQVDGVTRDIDHVAKAYLNLLRSKYIVHSTVTYNPGTPGSGGGRTAGARRGATRTSGAMNARAGRMGGRMGAMGPGGPGMMGPMGRGMGGPMGGMGMMANGAWPGNVQQGTTTASTDGGNPNEAMPINFSFALKDEFGLKGGGGGGGGGARAGRGGAGMMGPGMMGPMGGRGGGPGMGPMGRGGPGMGGGPMGRGR